ncbi:MAG: VOC family protein [Delftia acidovorans]|jgi:predicted 3-demethylubiquinone-9 3-methyltransferase (glyoxalase superfamily)|nr:VOC family protein [Delftia acidovorans]MDR3015530.1 VOC family protein [Delftia acidovorans]
MALHTGRIQPCLWFDNQGEQAAQFYTEVFPDSRITAIARYGEAGRDIHGRPAGSVMTVQFELDGQPFLALNGGPMFRFNEAVSLMVGCSTQDEIDHYWSRLSEGGDPAARQCGWLKDRYGLSWQIVPARMASWMGGPDAAAAQRVMQALLGMQKLDIAALERAHDGP